MKTFIYSLLATLLAIFAFSCSDDVSSPLKPGAGEPDESKISYDVQIVSGDYYCPFAHYVLQDKQGRLWSAVADMNMLNDINPYIGICMNGKNFRIQTDKLQSHPGCIFNCFFMDRQERIWFTISGSEKLFCVENDEITTIDPPEGRRFECASLTTNGKILTVLANLGFAEVDPNTKAYTMLSDTSRPLMDIGRSYISAMDSLGNYWEAPFEDVGTGNGNESMQIMKLYKMNYSSGFKTVNPSAEFSSIVSDISTFGNGNCVFCTWTDVSWIINGKQSYLSDNYPNLINEVRSPDVVAAESESVFWFGNESGLFKVRTGASSPSSTLKMQYFPQAE